MFRPVIQVIIRSQSPKMEFSQLLYLITFITFNVKFVGKDVWKETVGPSSYEICSVTHTN